MLKCIKFQAKPIATLSMLLISAIALGQATEDLSFLVGKWAVERVNSPENNPRTMRGVLQCEWTMDSTFIKCQYIMDRPGKIRGIDVVYFNYNSIYKKYEHLWLSSTWPIKVLMQGDLEENAGSKVLSTSAEFPIQDQATEYVKSALTFRDSMFTRRTHIRTSKDESPDWKLHMIETVTPIEEMPKKGN